MFTTRTWATELGVTPANRVVLPEPLSDTHSGEPGAWAAPGVAGRRPPASRARAGNGAVEGRGRRGREGAGEARESADGIEVQLRALTVPELAVRDLPSEIPGGPPPNRIIGRPRHRLEGDSARPSRSVTSHWPHNA